MEYALDAVFLTSPEGTILYANPAACALFGYTLDEFRTLGRSAVVDPSDPGLSEALEQRHRTGSFSGTLRMLRKDKSPLTAELSSAVFTDANGELRTGIFIRDITERKQAEERLKESLSLKRATLESTADGILVVNNQGKVVDFNTKFTELWNIPPDLMEQKDDNRLIQHVLDQLKYPETFVLKIRELYNKPDDESFDEIAFKDGRIFERCRIPTVLKARMLVECGVFGMLPSASGLRRRCISPSSPLIGPLSAASGSCATAGCPTSTIRRASRSDTPARNF